MAPLVISPVAPPVLMNVLARPGKLFVLNEYPFLPHHAAIIPVTKGPENDVPAMV